MRPGSGTASVTGPGRGGWPRRPGLRNLNAEVTVAGWAGHAALRVINVTAVGGNRHVTVGAWARRQSSESESDRRRSSCGPGGCPAKRRRLPGPGGWLSPSPSPSRSHRDPAWRSLRLPVASELLAVAQGRASPPGPSAWPGAPAAETPGPAWPRRLVWSGRPAWSRAVCSVWDRARARRRAYWSRQLPRRAREGRGLCRPRAKRGPGMLAK